MKMRPIVAAVLSFGAIGNVTELAADDLRNIKTGSVIYEHGYCDQPYVVIARDGTWICVFTTSAAREGARSQYVVSTTSHDRGRTWTPPVNIEPPDGPEASWAMPLITPTDRVYVFYDYNGDRVHTLPGGKEIRADMLGWYCFTYSDDHGRTWSKRYRLPVRVTACDRANQWGGKVQVLWGIGKPIEVGGSAIFGFTKLGRYMLDNGEGWFFRSDNILTETDPERIEWRMLPDGDQGVRAAEFGSVQEEHNIVPLSNGDLYCMYRTTTGHPVHCYSRNGGRTWTKPEVATYASGRPFKHPRACPRIWRCKNGKYLFWYHNHGGRDYRDRNPAWICGGIEQDGRILWSQPEILLYGENVSDRFSYPDLIEQDGRYWVTTTQKTRATVHEVDATLLEGVWAQREARNVVQDGLIHSARAPSRSATRAPLLPSLENGGFTIEIWLCIDSLKEGQSILDTRDKTGKGIHVSTAEQGAIRIDLNDGETSAGWSCDPGLIAPGKLHHVAIVVDGGPDIITFVVDGVVCDGGEDRQYGWGRFPATMGNVNGSAAMRITPAFDGQIENLCIYNRYLRNSEAIANYRAGLGEGGLTIDWKDNILTIHGDRLPGGELKVWYLEAFCRPGGHDRDWKQTTIPHKTELVAADPGHKRIRLHGLLADGVEVTQTITAGDDEVDFQLVASNPTNKESEVQYAQPCVRLQNFTGAGQDGYLAKSFIFVDGKLARMPTQPWATEARYVPGQLWRPANVRPADINPRPLSSIIPSNGLIGCFSGDEKMLFATAWEPWHELFQGVIVCLHSDFRIGGLRPHESKRIRGKIYLMENDVDRLLKRYAADFPEHAR